MTLTAETYERPSDYSIVITDDNQKVFGYSFSKQPLEGQELSVYLQNCKREALLLAENEMANNQPPQPVNI